MKVERYLTQRGRLIERALEKCLPTGRTRPQRLLKAMRYSLFGGGKRVRPLLVLAAADAVGGSATDAVPFACAVEMVHTYSLIHDDLPAMDDDALRRGKPTNHVVFGEGLAILAGDALLTEAFRVMIDAVRRDGYQRGSIHAMHEIARAAGVLGMVGGQAADLEAEGTVPDLPTVEFIHVRKTGALILAAVRAGALVGGANARQLRALTRYGECLGLAFQVADDILDLEGSVAVTGKVQGRDRTRHKATFPAVLGLTEAKRRTRDLSAKATAALGSLSAAADPLRHLVGIIAGRVAVSEVA